MCFWRVELWFINTPTCDLFITEHRVELKSHEIPNPKERLFSDLDAQLLRLPPGLDMDTCGLKNLCSAVRWDELLVFQCTY